MNFSLYIILYKIFTKYFIYKIFAVYQVMTKLEQDPKLIHEIIKVCRIAVFSLTMNFCNNSSKGSMPSRAASRRMACFTSSRTPLSAPRVVIRRSKIQIIIILIYIYHISNIINMCRMKCTL